MCYFIDINRKKRRFKLDDILIKWYMCNFINIKKRKDGLN